METSPGSYSWGGPDEVIGNAAARGIRVLPFIHGVMPEGVRNPPTRPADRRAFGRLMGALADRYGRGGAYWRGAYRRQHPGSRPRPVRSWQIFNEQNGRAFWGARPSPRAYARLVGAGARGVRSQDRRAEIVLGGMFGTPSGEGSITSWRYLKRLYRAPRIKRFFDTVALHPYSPNMRGLRVQMRRVRKVMRRNRHRGAGIWVTELGWGSDRGAHSLEKGPRGQARMLRKSFRLLSRHRNRRSGWNVRGLNWFAWQDRTNGCVFCSSSGLFSGPPGEREPKRSWGAFRRISR